jgi:hypothetical protein
MASNEYSVTYDAYMNRLQFLREKQTELELQLEEVSREADALDGIVKHLAPLTGRTILAEDVTSLGITNAVRSVLEVTQRRSAGEVKQKLEGAGFDLSKYTAPDQTIRKVLTRLVESGKAAVEKEGWKTYYTSVPTDDEIPF